MNKKLFTLLILTILTPIASASSMDILATDPAPIEPGDVVDITVRLDLRSDTDITSATLQPLRTDLVRPIGNVKSYSKIQQGDTITATMTVAISNEAPEGNIPILFRLRGDNYQKTFDKRVRIADSLENPTLRIGSIRTVPQDLLRDTDNNELQITLNNLGDKAAQQLLVDIRETEGLEPSYTYSLRDTASRLLGNEDTTLTFKADITEDAPDILQTTMDIEYKIADDDSSNSMREESLQLDIPLSKSPFLTVTDVEQRGSFAPGSNDNELRLTVQNTGEGDAEDARIRIFPDISYPFIFDATTKYAASILEEGESVTVPFDVEVVSDADQREFPLRTELESRVGSTRYDRSERVSITVEGDPVSDFPIQYVTLIGIAILAIGIGVYRKQKST